MNANQNGKTATIENQIQITPILDTAKPSNATISGSATPQLNSQPITSLNSNQTIAMNLPANQQMLNIPNNVQIISSVSVNNSLNTHANILTNSMASNAANSGGGVILNAPQQFNSLQRQSTSQSTPVHTINNQGNLMNSGGDHR